MLIEIENNQNKPKQIYIVGSLGSGKTTLAKRISKKTNVECYHLDEIFYMGLEKRPKTECYELFHNIIIKQYWIAEDLGRKCFEEALIEADCIIILHPHLCIRIKRIIIRHIKQNVGIEKCSYIPDFNMLKRLFQGLQEFEKGKDDFFKRNLAYKEKTIVLKTNKEIRMYLDSLQY